MLPGTFSDLARKTLRVGASPFLFGARSGALGLREGDSNRKPNQPKIFGIILRIFGMRLQAVLVVLPST